MCGRYSEKGDVQKLTARFGITQFSTELSPRYNIAPTQDAPVLIDNDGIELVSMRWGLIPNWAKDPSIGNRMINARSETIADKPSFKGPLRRSRCIIPADGFYEWKREPGAKKGTPMRILLKSEEHFGFAGLWDEWKAPNDTVVQSFTIITTEANKLIKPIHERMPVILSKKHESTWINSKIADPEIITPLLRPYPSEEMKFYEVSTLVNSPRNDSPECLTPA